MDVTETFIKHKEISKEMFNISSDIRETLL